MSLLDMYTDVDYPLCLEASGDGEVCEKSFGITLDKIFGRYKKKCGGFPAQISLLIRDTLAAGLDYGFTSIDTAFLERLETLKELGIPDSVTHIEMTERLERILKENNTLIRGSFDSFAERFASQNGLNFRHRDFFFASSYFEPAFESTTLTMMFSRDGSVVIEEKVSSPGSSAGNTFGGEFYKTLESDFFMHKTAQDIANMYGSRIRNAIIEKGLLADFIEKARTHDLYTGEN